MQIKRRFGRLIEFDERSREYPIRSMIHPQALRISKLWSCDIVLDQGSEAACTGFSVSAEAAAEPVVVPGITNEIALALYHRARELDSYPGEDYEGSSVLGAMKAGREKGWYKAFRWAFGEDDLALSIGHCGPAVLGIQWREGMSNPDNDGFIYPTGEVVGGHAILCNGYFSSTDIYRLHNSWGASWGVDGECFIHAADLKKLLKDHGEACIPVVRSQQP